MHPTDKQILYLMHLIKVGIQLSNNSIKTLSLQEKWNT